MKRLLPVLIVLILLLVSCSQDDKVSKDDYYLMYAHLSQMWAQSLEHTDAENA